MQKNIDNTQTQAQANKPRLFIPTYPEDARTITDFISLSQDYVLIVGHTGCDVPAFIENPEAFEEMVDNGTIVIERFLDVDEMTAKDFYWSSRSMETPASKSFDEAISILPDNEGIKQVAKVIMEKGLSNGQWEKGPWLKAEKISAEIISVLKVPADATRTTVFDAAKSAGRMDLWVLYDEEVQIPALTSQHRCVAYANRLGSVTKI